MLVVALFSTSGTVAAAYTNVPDVRESKDTDGWQLTIAITDVDIESVPNIAATPTSREGFVTATVTESITRIHNDTASPEETLISGKIQFEPILGCQWEADNLTISPNEYPVGPAASTTFTPGSGDPPSISVGIQPNSDAEALLSGVVNPGAIKTDTAPAEKEFLLSDKTITEEEANRGHLNRVISIERQHVNMDKCGGPVVIQLQATGKMTTNHSDSYLTAYSPILSL